MPNGQPLSKWEGPDQGGTTKNVCLHTPPRTKDFPIHITSTTQMERTTLACLGACAHHLILRARAGARWISPPPEGGLYCALTSDSCGFHLVMITASI